MLLNKDNTKWIFLCAISTEKSNKLRHLKDIAFGILVLQQKGIHTNQIEILIDEFDGYEDDDFVKNFLSPFTIKSYTSLHEEITSVHEENLVLIVSGHGNEFGLSTPTPVKPYNLMNALHLNTKIRSASVILVQCFAGVFNYTNTTKKDAEGKTVYTNICLLGASHLNSSLSGLVPISLNQKDISWVANIFLFHFFDWILNPQDIDGDSKNTLMDVFKYAGSKSSQQLLMMKRAMFQDASQLQIDLYQVINKIKDLKTSLLTEMDEIKTQEIKNELFSLELQYDSIKEVADLNIELSYTNQDPWILNANAARKIEFAL